MRDGAWRALAAAGEARAARDAQQHGLSLSVLADPALAAEVAILARAIAGEGANSELQEHASRIAEEQIDLVRVRRARHQLLSRALGNPDDQSPAAVKMPQALPARLARRMGSDLLIPHGIRQLLIAKPQRQDKDATILPDDAARLAAMDRYKRRALSR